MDIVVVVVVVVVVPNATRDVSKLIRSIVPKYCSEIFQICEV